MSSNPLVSIIIPAYKGEQRIARAVTSVFQQDYTNWEIIIISDDQQDYNKALVQQGLRSDKIRFETTGKTGTGAGAARNVGLNSAKGNFIAFLDCDDAWDASYLSAMLPLAKKYGAAISQINMIDEAHGKSLPLASVVMDTDVMLPSEATMRCMHAFIPLVFDRGKINHSFMPLERMADYVFVMQMFNAVDRIGYSNAPAYRYYKHFGSSTQFTHDVAAIAQKFISVFEFIKQSVGNGSIAIAGAAIKQIMINDMDMLIAAERYFIDAARSNPAIQFYEILPSFMEQWRLAAVRRSAG